MYYALKNAINSKFSTALDFKVMCQNTRKPIESSETQDKSKETEQTWFLQKWPSLVDTVSKPVVARGCGI